MNFGWDKRYKIKNIVNMILETSHHKPETLKFNRTKHQGQLSGALACKKVPRMVTQDRSQGRLGENHQLCETGGI
jgi:hypothetical protein